MDHDLCVNNGNGVVLPRDRVRRVGRAIGNGVSGSARYPRFLNDMESQIHQHEQDAYISVLRAFKVQSDALSWEKERLMTELRIELRVSDEEHRECLKRVYADDNCSTISKKQKISSTFGNRGVAGHALRDIASIESAQYYSTGPTKRGTRRGVRVRGVKKSMDHDGAVSPLQSTSGNPDDIEMVLTETVIAMVEKVLLSSHPEPFEIERAMTILKNQEERLIDAVNRIEHASESEIWEGKYAEPSMGREQELTNKQQDINGPPSLGAEDGMMTEGEGGGNGDQESHENSKVAASND